MLDGIGFEIVDAQFPRRGGSTVQRHQKSSTWGILRCRLLCCIYQKYMHIRRVTTNPKHERMFFIAYITQLAGVLALIFFTARVCFVRDSDNRFLAWNAGCLGLGLLRRGCVDSHELVGWGGGVELVQWCIRSKWISSASVWILGVFQARRAASARCIGFGTESDSEVGTDVAIAWIVRDDFFGIYI